MPLSAGDILGPYEILEPVGKGGMGEVWKARDTRLDRVVAIKTSNQQFTERFEREARAVAALNHPNICTLHDVGPSYLVMEYVEGVALKGPLPLEEVLRVGRQISSALEAAHEKGITHRDLKPGNILMKPDGTVKVLDFGLAKIGARTAASGGDPECSPTISMAATQAGMILGTAAYMAPEQAKGKEVDKRADIWAFGVVLYELTTGSRAFQGGDMTEILASVIKEHPTLEPVPHELRRLLKKCLEKDPAKRLRDIGDVWELLDAGPGAGPTVRRGTGFLWPAVAAIGILLAAGLAALHFTETPAPLPHLRFEVVPPEGVTFAGSPPRIALSPDGTQIAFNGIKDSKVQTWVRRLDTGDARPLPGSEGSETPFWSPDSKSVGIFAGGKLKRIDVASGNVQVLCDAPGNNAGGSWSPDGQTILFSGSSPDTPVHRVAASGGTPSAVLKLLPQETGQFWPRFLADGKHFVYYAQGKSAQDTGVAVASLDGTDRKLLLSSAYSAGFAGGHLFYRAEEALVARPFDSDKLEFTGEPVQVLPSVTALANGRLSADISSNGFLVANEAGAGGGTHVLAWVNRSGKQLATVGQPGTYQHPSLSPDGRQLAVTKAVQGTTDVWSIDLARNVSSRITLDPANDFNPMFSRDGRGLLFASPRKGPTQIFTRPTSGLGEDQLLVASDAGALIPHSVSRDGKYLLFTRGAVGTRDVYAFPLLEKGQPIPVLTSPFEEWTPRFSPDGRWIAYVSNESGQSQVYVRSFPGSERRVQVSTLFGTQPRWRGDGTELYYLNGDRAMVAVAIRSLASLELGESTVLFLTSLPINLARVDYDVTADGSRFLLNQPVTAAEQPSLTVIQNWQALLKGR